MQVKNIDGLTVADIKNEVDNGAKFVIYQYAISLVVITFKRSSDIYFVRNGENAVVKGLPYTLIAFFLGWWGIPWGPVYTIQSLAKNFGGGKDVTQEMLQHMLRNAMANA